MFHEVQQPAPKRHEQIEPEKDDEKVDVVHRQTVEKGLRQIGHGKGLPIMAENGSEGQVKQGPCHVRHEDGAEAPPEISHIMERLMQRLAVKHAEGGKKEKCRHGKAR